MFLDNVMTANATGLELLSSFHDYQFDAIISAIEAEEIPYQLEFFVHIGGAFNLFVAKQYLEQATQITTGIEIGKRTYNKSVAIAKYNAAKSKT